MMFFFFYITVVNVLTGIWLVRLSACVQEGGLMRRADGETEEDTGKGFVVASSKSLSD